MFSGILGLVHKWFNGLRRVFESREADERGLVRLIEAEVGRRVVRIGESTCAPQGTLVVTLDRARTDRFRPHLETLKKYLGQKAAACLKELGAGEPFVAVDVQLGDGEQPVVTWRERRSGAAAAAAAGGGALPVTRRHEEGEVCIEFEGARMAIVDCTRSIGGGAGDYLKVPGPARLLAVVRDREGGVQLTAGIEGEVYVNGARVPPGRMAKLAATAAGYTVEGEVVGYGRFSITQRARRSVAAR